MSERRQWFAEFISRFVPLVLCFSGFVLLTWLYEDLSDFMAPAGPLLRGSVICAVTGFLTPIILWLLKR